MGKALKPPAKLRELIDGRAELRRQVQAWQFRAGLNAGQNAQARTELIFERASALRLAAQLNAAQASNAALGAQRDAARAELGRIPAWVLYLVGMSRSGRQAWLRLRARWTA